MKKARYKKWTILYMPFRGEEPHEALWYVMTSEYSNAFVFSGTLEECKAWIDERKTATELHCDPARIG
jgi:hypothetical protein